jgi:hypothetical protein
VISPDGERVVFAAARQDGHSMLCARALDSLQSQVNRRAHINRSNLLVLESKADMQKRGQASPDDGDALIKPK